MLDYLRSLGIRRNKSGVWVLIFVVFLLPEVSGQNDSRIPFKENGKWGFLDVNENIIVPPLYREVGAFHSGRADVSRRGRWGLIDKDGNVLVKCRYDRPVFNSGHKNLYLVVRNDHWGIVDTTGKKRVPVRYDFISPFWQGRARVRKNGKMGMADTLGNFPVPVIFDTLGPMYPGKGMMVNFKGNWGLVDQEGKYLIGPDYDTLRATDHPKLFFARKEGKVGFVNTSNESVFTFKKELLPEINQGNTIADLKKTIQSLEICNEDKIIQQSQAEEIARDLGLYENLSPYFPPSVRMEKFEDTCCWKISTSSVSQTREGNCRYTNGCTVVVKRFVYIDTQSGKILHRDYERKVYPNYE